MSGLALHSPAPPTIEIGLGSIIEYNGLRLNDAGSTVENITINPRAGVDLTGLSGYGTFTRITSGVPGGYATGVQSSGAVAATAAALATWGRTGSGTGTGANPIVVSRRYAARSTIRIVSVSSGSVTQISTRIYWYALDGTNVSNSIVASQNSPVTGTDYALAGFAVAPVGAAYGVVRSVASITNPTTFDSRASGALMYEESTGLASNVLAYWDGSTANAYWTGTAHGSTSVFMSSSGGGPERYVVKSLSTSMPDIRDFRELNPSTHGATAYDSFYGGRSIQIEGQIRASNLAGLRVMSNNLREAFGRLADSYLIFTPGGVSSRQARILCKTTNLAITEVQDTANYWRRNFQITMRAARPFVLENSTSTSQALATVTYAARTYNKTYDRVYSAWAEADGDVAAQNSLTVTNTGNFAAQPVIKIDGPVTNPIVTNTTNGQALLLTGTIANLAYVQIDIANKTMIDNAGASKYSMLNTESDWLTLDPGANVFALSGSGLGANSKVTVTFEPTWL